MNISNALSLLETCDELYIWDDQKEIGRVCNGKVCELRTLGEGLGVEIGASVFLEIEKEIYFPHHDIQGSLVTLIDTDGNSHSTYRYTAFGEQLAGEKTSPWRFASKRYDEETDFIYFGRRYYSPRLGRWTTADPQGFDDGPNLYAYVHNCPLTDYDLYGMWSMRTAWENTQHFMWGMLEGSAYHFSNMASSICMRDFSIQGWQPQSLLSDQDTMLSNRGLDFAEKTFLPFTYEARRLGNDVSQHDLMRSRGRAFGEQVITLGGLFSAFSAGKCLLNTNTHFQKAARFPSQQLTREYLFSGKPLINESQAIQSRRLKPDLKAEGAHTVFGRDFRTGKVNHYETFRPQTNPYDPKSWESISRFDSIGSDPHWNKVLKKDIFAPHIHDPYYPGGVRKALPWEIPH